MLGFFMRMASRDTLHASQNSIQQTCRKASYVRQSSLRQFCLSLFCRFDQPPMPDGSRNIRGTSREHEACHKILE